jgi:CheY-like chemotaxis protein
VVEDDEEMRTLAVALLVDLGYATMAAETAPAALDILQHTGTIDLALSDVVLPGAVNGPALAIELQHRTRRSKSSS